MGGYEVRNNITLTVTVCIAWFDVIGEPQRASCILGEEYVLTYVCFSKKKIVCLSCYESWLNVRTISLLFQIKFVIQVTETFLHNPSEFGDVL